MSSQHEFTRVRYQVDEAVATITLARAEKANAQDFLLLAELNQAMDLAAHDKKVKVIVLGADGKHFSSGHDLGSLDELPSAPLVGTETDFEAPGAAGTLNIEREYYLGYAKRWREIPKPTIARVQGRVIAGGLVLMWPMDLIVCSENASFCDPVVTFGANGVEYFAHPYEVGARTAKDMLFTGRTLNAYEAQTMGMVQRVFSIETLNEQTHELAKQISLRPAIALATAKRTVNAAQDAMGFDQTLETAFAHHHMLHAHWIGQHGELAPPGTSEQVREVLRAGAPTGTVHASAE